MHAHLAPDVDPLQADPGEGDGRGRHGGAAAGEGEHGAVVVGVRVDVEDGSARVPAGVREEADDPRVATRRHVRHALDEAHGPESNQGARRARAAEAPGVGGPAGLKLLSRGYRGNSFSSLWGPGVRDRRRGAAGGTALK